MLWHETAQIKGKAVTGCVKPVSHATGGTVHTTGELSLRRGVEVCGAVGREVG